MINHIAKRLKSHVKNTKYNSHTQYDCDATLINYEIKKVENKIKNKKGMETTKTIPKNKIEYKKRSTN